ncbi:phage tail tape measure protein [Paenibacillus oryzisoli]|uniref:Phage tail tape measure protein domain-containing protein n=1 Tax=Paenibacillus oryzisoli TaxID=1850517 RepID=A0A198AJM5_9BACL|nr:phage tail tape measure protein [Paenibacillus oryzisoli]OAS21133.1 hypothetical protein A8708_30040 [Paenibacillus oryzisoli]
MADIEVGDLVARISFDDTGLNSSMAAINRQIRLVQSEFDRASSSLQNYGSAEERLQARSTSLTQQMSLQQQRINLLNQQFQESAREKGLDAAATQQLAIQLNQAQTSYNRLENQLQRVNTELAAQSTQVEETGQSFKRAEIDVAAFGKAAAAGIAAAGLAFAGVVAKAVSFSDDLTKALNKAKSATGNFEAENYELKEVMVDLFNQGFGEDFADIGKAITTVGQVTGATGVELERMTKSAFLLSDVFEYDINESTRTAKTLMTNFGISANQAFTLIAQGAQNGADKNGDLLDTLNEYAPQFKALGFSANQFTDVLIAGAENGTFSIDKVGDAVKEFNIRAKDGSKTTADGFKSLGYDADKMAQTFAAGGEKSVAAFNALITKLSELKDPVEQNRIAIELFGTQFEDIGLSATVNLGNVESVANQTADTLQQINNTKYDSVGEAIQGIGRNLQTGILLPLADKVLPKLQEFTDYIKVHMPEIQANISAALDVGIKLFDKLTVAVKFLIDSMDILLPVIAGVTAAIVAQTVIDGLVKLYKAWQVATTAQTTAQWLLNLALNANPLGLVALAIGAVVTAGVLLYKNWDTVTEKLGQLWDYMKDIGGKIKTFFGEVFGGLATGFKGYVNTWITSLNALIRGLNKLKFDFPDWVPGLGGKSFGINIPTIPMLANGGNIAEAGMALVGEAGPELLKLPKGAQVQPLIGPNAVSSQPQTMVANVYLNSKQIATAVAGPLNDLTRTQRRGMGVS